MVVITGGKYSQMRASSVSCWCDCTSVTVLLSFSNWLMYNVHRQCTQMYGAATSQVFFGLCCSNVHQQINSCRYFNIKKEFLKPKKCITPPPPPQIFYSIVFSVVTELPQVVPVLGCLPSYLAKQCGHDHPVLGFSSSGGLIGPPQTAVRPSHL